MKCKTCQDMGVIKKGVAIAHIVYYPRGGKTVSYVEPESFNFEDCPARCEFTVENTIKRIRNEV